MSRRSGWVAAALSLAILGACMVSEPPVQEAATQVATQEAIGVPPCQEEICGSNSPVIDAIGTHEFNLLGVVNREGFELQTANGFAQIIKGSTSYRLRVVGGVITGTRLFATLSGQALVNAWIPVRNRNTGRRYALVIRTVRTMNFFVPPPPALPPPFPPPPPPPSFEAYTFAWRSDADDRLVSLCNNLEGLRKLRAQDPEQADLELMELTELESVMYEGDRVETRTMTMSKLADDDWVNVGCAGHTLAKLWLTRNTVHSQRAGLQRAWEHRQSTLKLLVSDICGTGDIFTSFGQRLVWNGDFMSFFEPPATLEARWTEDGAKCVNVHRMENPTTELGREKFKNIWAQITKVCTPRRCTNLDPHDFDGTLRVSANP